MKVHLVDGTYELFRHFFGAPPHRNEAGQEVAAVRGVLGSVLQLLEEGATHVGVATDHVIESFRNDMWAGYKTGDGVDPDLKSQFWPLEDALAALGVFVWPMVELEADDALASAAAHGDIPVTVRGAAKLAVTLQNDFDRALLFKDLATLRVDRDLLPGVDALRWVGPTTEFSDVCDMLDARGVEKRAEALASQRTR